MLYALTCSRSRGSFPAERLKLEGQRMRCPGRAPAPSAQLLAEGLVFADQSALLAPLRRIAERVEKAPAQEAKRRQRLKSMNHPRPEAHFFALRPVFRLYGREAAGRDETRDEDPLRRSLRSAARTDVAVGIKPGNLIIRRLQAINLKRLRATASARPVAPPARRRSASSTPATSA